ncbi:outer membrane protein assembly factor BamE [Trinickia sp.]|uniref:outer membrane protein assembly factor BamE n=1 Tax=Trinickia sp. TaxID=2571163 RepID=UPI003F7CE1C3
MNPIFLKKRGGSHVRNLLIAASMVALVSGCSTYDSLTQRVAQSITPYRITIVQGNFVSKEAAEKMRVGMSRDEVKAVLGTPLLTDMFHDDRWDYVFYFKRGSTAVVQQRDFIVNFKGDRVESWSGGENLPSELELLADIDGDKRGKKAKAAAPASSAAAASAAAEAAAPASSAAAAAQGASGASSTSEEAANAQAAQAANRATNQVPATPSKPAVRSGTPSPSGALPSATPQFQFHRQPQPASPDQSNPVGPTGSSSGSSGAGKQSVSSQGASSTGG